ncbi:MAG: AAA family ATPase [SAR324 cluster bacterium]|nr:AAA family ATPase [SAR324 cluster bacterium]
MSSEAYKEVGDCRPQVIEHFVGQKRIVERCKVALEAAWNQGTKLPHLLMQGSPGLGKTELSHILSKEMGCELHEQLAQNISKPSDLHSLLLTPQDREVVLLDEIHELPPIAQTTLYRAMENQQIFLESRRDKKSRPVQIANFTIIGATTDPQRLLAPLRDRFRMVLDLEPYQVSELEMLLKSRCRQLGWIVEDQVFYETAKRGKGTPRIALRLLESVRMTASANNSKEITMGHFERACELQGIDPIGLTNNEVKYLKILYDNDGSARLNVLASRLSLHSRHVSKIIEDYLIREGIVTKSNSLRILTQYGLEHIRKYHL